MSTELSPLLLLELFGSHSLVRSRIETLLKELFIDNTVGHQSIVQKRFEEWEQDIFPLYGSGYNKTDLFLTHTYLLLVVEQVCNHFLKTFPSLGELGAIPIIKNLHLATNTENRFIHWMLVDNNSEVMTEVSQLIGQELRKAGVFHISGDIFQALYEDLISTTNRHKTGEYYTPNWLAKYLVEDILERWTLDHTKCPVLLDPACGSGVFLVHYILILRTRQSLILAELLKLVQGFDINPIACYLARANILLACGPMLVKPNEAGVSSVLDPIQRKDVLAREELASGGRVDVLVGNPPWVVMRSLSSEYGQEQLKKAVFHYKLLQKGQNHLFTQMEVSTLFFSIIVDLYLKQGGLFALVMPKSVIAGTMHHEEFRKFQSPKIGLITVIDLHQVQPLFGMPGCVLVGQKGIEPSFPVPMIKVKGKLGLELQQEDVVESLDWQKDIYSPPITPTERSYYYNLFKVGASIFPRNFYFVEVDKVEGERVLARTSPEVAKQSKGVWREVMMEGWVPRQHVFWTILAWEMVPFGYLNTRSVVVPTFPTGEKFSLLENNSSTELNWFDTANSLWQKLATTKSKINFPQLVHRLNYNNLMTAQNPQKRYVVLYSGTGTNICACVVDKDQPTNTPIIPNTLVVDVKTWYYETDVGEEANYLCAVLNSPVLNDLIKPLQPQGLGGGRAIHRRPLLFSIPQYTQADDLSCSLAELGSICQRRVTELRGGKHEKLSRGQVRNVLREELATISELTKKLINLDRN